jgi:hypothetical protein
MLNLNVLKTNVRALTRPHTIDITSNRGLKQKSSRLTPHLLTKLRSSRRHQESSNTPQTAKASICRSEGDNRRQSLILENKKQTTLSYNQSTLSKISVKTFISLKAFT